MSLRVAVQMDPIETVNIGGDSSFALMIEGQARGHGFHHYAATALSAENGRVRAHARPLTVRALAGDHFRWTGDAATLDLADDVDVVLMRQDPPFDMGYTTATHLLEKISGAKSVTVRFAGRDRIRDHKMTSAEKTGLKSVLAAYSELKQKL